MVRIRLRRMGQKHKPAYRIVVADSRAPRDGKFIETIGHYNPQLQPKIVFIKEDRARYWLSVGAQPSDTVTRLFKGKSILDAEGKVTESLVAPAETPAAPAKTSRRKKPTTAAPASKSIAAAPAATEEAPVATEEAPAAEPVAATETPEAGPYTGSVKTLQSGDAPEGYAIKGNDSSKLYHVPGSRYYNSTIAEYWFDTVENAEAAGFRAPGQKAASEA